MTKLTALSILGSRWYATIVDGNLTQKSPTNFSRHLTLVEVVAEIRRRTPDVSIDFVPSAAFRPQGVCPNGWVAIVGGEELRTKTGGLRRFGSKPAALKAAFSIIKKAVQS